MADVVILFSKDCNTTGLWVSYLDSSFQKMRAQNNQSQLRIQHIPVEDIHPGMAHSSYEKLNHAKLQLIIVSPAFLDHIYNHPDCGIGPLLHPHRVLALFLGVSEENVTEHHRAVLFSYQQWTCLQAVDQDIDFIGNVFEEASKILKKYQNIESRQQQKARFSILPKKVKEGYNKVVVLLSDPLAPEDTVNVTVDKVGQILEVENVIRRNPYALQFSIPETCLSVSMLVTVSVEKNGTSLGRRQVKCESKMRELDHLLRSVNAPMEFICQTLGFAPNALDQLDEFLASEFQRNCLPQMFSFISNNRRQGDGRRSVEEYPTLLHFAAHFGLHKLAWQLLEHPQGEEACCIVNASDLTPAEMADNAGHQQLANALRGYMEMSELSHMYQYIKMVCEKPEKTPEKGDWLSNEDNVYDSPRPMEQTYLIPPTARPVVLPQQNSQASPSDNDDGNNYLQMQPVGRTGDDRCTLNRNDSQPVGLHPGMMFLNCMENAERQNSQDEGSSKGTTFNESVLVKNVQGELVDMINDYKNNFFTINEVEQLFENWKTRIDVQRSHSEKQQQLEEMRAEYQRIQQNMKEKMKKATPFERIAKFFQRGKSKNKESSSRKVTSTGEPTSTISIKERPASSLSTNSSLSTSSSERMSTLSVCSHGSLADSGNHSDSGEDKKVNGQMNFGNKDYFCKPFAIPSWQKFPTYEIPPPPLPVMRRPADSSRDLGIHDRPPLPVPRPISDEDSNPYYIEPPSLCIPEGTDENEEQTNSEDTLEKVNSSEPASEVTQARPPSPVYLECDDIEEKPLHPEGNGESLLGAPPLIPPPRPEKGTKPPILSPLSAKPKSPIMGHLPSYVNMEAASSEKEDEEILPPVPPRRI